VALGSTGEMVSQETRNGDRIVWNFKFIFFPRNSVKMHPNAAS